MTDPTEDENQNPKEGASTPPPQSQEQNEVPQWKEAPKPSCDPSEKIQEIKEKATEAFKSGTVDAREAFTRNFPNAKQDIAKGINDVSYAIGYAVSFGSTLVREFTPKDVSEGFERGTAAGSKAAEEVVKHRKSRASASSPPPDPPEDPDPNVNPI